jgi:hypothetical protein
MAEIGARSRKRGIGAAAIVVVVAALAAMGRVCFNDFAAWDDGITLYNNPKLNPPTLDGVRYYWDPRHADIGLYVPVTYSAWAALAQVAYVATPDEYGTHLNPWVFHTFSVLVHVAAALVVLAILRRFIADDWAAALGAIVFAVHPVQVEAVAWASGLKDLLCGLFSLVAVWQYVKWAGEGSGFRVGGSGEEKAHSAVPSSGGRGGGAWWHFALAAAALVVGMLAKPAAVVAPLVAGVIDWWVIGRPLRKVVGPVAVLLVVALPLVVVARGAQDVSWVEAVVWWKRPLVAGDAVAFYLGKLVWPVGLAIDYGRTPQRIFERGSAHWTWVVPLVVAAVVWAGRRRWPWLAGAALVFVAGLLPVLGLSRFQFQQHSTVADHYLYVAMLGVAMAVAFGLARHGARATRWTAAVVIVVLTAVSAIQAGVWRDTRTLFAHALKVNPDSVAAYNNLGAELVRVAQWQQTLRAPPQVYEPEYREAIGYLEKAVALRPKDTLVRNNLSSALAAVGQLREAAGQMEEVVRLTFDQPVGSQKGLDETLLLLGRIEMNLKRYPEAVRYLTTAAQRRPVDVEVEEALREAREKLRAASAPSPATRGGAATAPSP